MWVPKMELTSKSYVCLRTVDHGKEASKSCLYFSGSQCLVVGRLSSRTKGTVPFLLFDGQWDEETLKARELNPHAGGG
ncbi:hypothetical protein MPTK1_8g07040 [Marchantia polymorpha subsp. ruderalis]|uniref:Uncharacterized protein n=1 Tax=Marchantia polymorpha TaxID=3197 RepID=A0A2R6XIG4_MARPO|nr:hypothetical protein MARPO_0013s0088 [Marchantia polymorpha]BBN18984.1 hypothetical protein Mp_8g07040 [Marchantia polymorpha subsp. ruderalis]|eukprot:PTQ45862.1 hypothetical protein MARPO_0013s0088 [Marchantia polymorpha]